MNRILLLTDLSEESLDGIRYGIQLYGNRTGSEAVEFVLYHAHYIEMPIATYGAPGVRVDPAIEIKASREKFDEIHDSLQKEYPDVAMQKLFDENRLVTGVKASHEEHPFDLIVMATQQKSALDRLVLGSNALEVVKEAPCPLLVVPPLSKYKAPGKILLATDFRNLEDLEILQPVSQLQQANAAEVMMLHVYNPDKADPNQMTAEERRLGQYFENTAFRHFFLEHDDPVKGIEHFMTGYPTDMLVLISHERNLMQRIFHKSVSKQLVIHAGVPILIVKSKSDGKKTLSLSEIQKNQVKKWQSQLGTMEVQWNLGKKELADEMGKTRNSAGGQWQKVKDKLDGFSELSGDKWEHFKDEMQESISHLGRAFGIGKGNNKES